jgi:predicted RNase H-like HicB family nuclease
VRSTERREVAVFSSLAKIEQYSETSRVEVMKKYLIVIEPAKTGFSAYSPDLPACVSTGQTHEEVEQNMREAIAFHLDGLREEGQAVPEPQTYSTYVELPT